MSEIELLDKARSIYTIGTEFISLYDTKDAIKNKNFRYNSGLKELSVDGVIQN
jgi:hypothetical protein